MKFIAVALLITGFGSSAALATTKGPIVVKSSGGGHVAQDWRTNETCEVFADKVVVTRSFASGKIVTKEVHPLNLSGTGTLVEVVDRANSEAIESKDNNMCDGPYTSIVANREGARGERVTVEIFSTGGCGSPSKNRNGAYSFILKTLANTYCPAQYEAPQY